MQINLKIRGLKYQKVKRLATGLFEVHVNHIRGNDRGRSPAIYVSPRLIGGAVTEDQPMLAMYNADGILVYLPLRIARKLGIPFQVKSKARSEGDFYTHQELKPETVNGFDVYLGGEDEITS
jgi:hypothetical protein